MLFLAPYKNKILTQLESTVASKQISFSNVNHWGADVLEKIIPFCKNGKMIRGSLILYGHTLFAQKIDKNALLLAAALELNQAAIISHDDVIDEDVLRRGSPSIFAQYEDRAHREKFKHARHFGYSQAICWSDVCFFLCFELLSSLKLNEETKQKIMSLYAREMQYVGIAEMQDVYASYKNDSFSEDDILTLYRYKTGRYTFSAPLMMGAILCKQSPQTINRLSNLGELLGLMFQISDDTLSLFGDEAVTGKPVGTDVRRNNKTLYHHHLFVKVNPSEKEKLQTIFGNVEATSADIEIVKALVKKYKIDTIIEEKLNNYFNEGLTLIKKLHLKATHAQELESLLNFCRSRSV